MKQLNIVFLVLSTITSFILGFYAFPNKAMESYYTSSIYYILLANLLLWIFALIRAENKSKWPEVKIYFKRHYIAFIGAFAIMLLGVFIAKPDFRILADETNLLSMSQALYEEQQCKNYTSVLYYYYGFKKVISYVIDKRPALFPLTLSFCHSIFGYRPENIFILNIVSGFLTLLLLYHLISLKLGRFWGICGMLILASYPLFIIYANSGGFEIFNLLFSLILFYCLIKFLKQPNILWAEVLVMFLPLISQTRYESVLSIICILPIIFICLPQTEYSKIGYKFILAPLFFIPVAWLRLISDNANAWQIKDMNAGFGLEWLVKNSKQALVFFFSGTKNYAVVPIISILAVFGFLFLIKTIFYKNNKKEIKFFWISVFLFYILHSIARFYYSLADLTQVAESRLALVLLPPLVYMSLIFLKKCRYWFGIRKSYYIIGILALILVYWQDAGLNIGVRDLTLYREFRSAREYLENNFPNKNEYILVADRANLYVPLKYNTINFMYLKNNLDTIMQNFKNRTYSYLILVQTINKSSNKAIASCQIPDSLNTQTLYENQIRVDQYLRFSILNFK